jgi:SAM-dependent methyltransferase
MRNVPMAKSLGFRQDPRPEGERNSLVKEMRHPKIETIQDIRNKGARDTLVNAIQEYMRDANYAKEPAKYGKDWLDCVTEAMEIERIASACRNVRVEYKTWAASGIGALTHQRDPVREMHSGMLHRIAKKSGIAKERLKGQVLDFGCGVGWLTQLLRNRFHSEAIGVDIDRSAIELGRFFGVKGLIALDGNQKRIPFDNSHFDIVVLKDVLNAPSIGGWYEEDVLTEVSRVTKNEGLLLLSEDGVCGMAATLRPYGFELIVREPAWSAWMKRKKRMERAESERHDDA